MTTDLKNKLDVVRAGQDVAKDNTIMAWMKDPKMRGEMTKALPKQLSGDRFLRVLLTEIRQNPKLLECTPSSFMACVMDMAQLGLEPGPLGHVYLIPFKNNNLNVTECTMILGYKGMINLARRSGDVKSMTAEVVRANDHFDFEFGTEKKLIHRPVLDDPGEAIAFYAIVQYLNGGTDFKVLSKVQVEKFRARSRAKNSGPWVTDYDSMGMKTSVRRLATFMPLTPEAAEAITLDEERELGLSKTFVEGIELEPPIKISETGSNGEDTLHQPSNKQTEVAVKSEASGQAGEEAQAVVPPHEAATGAADRREATPVATEPAPVTAPTDDGGDDPSKMHPAPEAATPTEVKPAPAGLQKAIAKLGNTLTPKWKRDDYAKGLIDYKTFDALFLYLVSLHEAACKTDGYCDHVKAAVDLYPEASGITE